MCVSYCFECVDIRRVLILVLHLLDRSWELVSRSQTARHVAQRKSIWEILRDVVRGFYHVETHKNMDN